MVFDRADGAGVLGAKRCKHVQRRPDDGILLRGGVDDPDRLGLRPAEPPAGGHGGHRGLRGQFGLDQRRHAGRERDADVDFREAEVAAVYPHHPKVVRQRQHRGRAEAVAADGRGGGHRQCQHPGQ